MAPISPIDWTTPWCSRAHRTRCYNPNRPLMSSSAIGCFVLRPLLSECLWAAAPVCAVSLLQGQRPRPDNPQRPVDCIFPVYGRAKSIALSRSVTSVSVAGIPSKFVVIARSETDWKHRFQGVENGTSKVANAIFVVSRNLYGWGDG